MNGLSQIILDLERQKLAIDQALEALRALNNSAPREPERRGRKPGTKVSRKLVRRQITAPAKVAGTFTDEGRLKLAESMKRRWAAKRAAAKKAARSNQKAQQGKAPASKSTRKVTSKKLAGKVGRPAKKQSQPEALMTTDQA